MKLAKLFGEFIKSEQSGGIILLVITAISLVLANSSFQERYLAFWHLSAGGHSIVHWINDGLMTIFFLLIGLELEREIYTGELSNLKKASLPVFGALGGMLVPAGIYLLINLGKGNTSGAGIPMATDIAFAIGALSLLGNHVPPSLKIFLTAFAVIDDLGAIIVIAIFYTASPAFVYLIIALGIFGVLIILNRLKVYSLIPYLIGGAAMWYFMLNSGVHATLSGVLLAFAVPFGDGGEKSPSCRLQHYLHKPVAFIILPLFAAANTSIAFREGFINELISPYSTGIIAGLIIGKPAGIFLFSMAAIGIGFSEMPEGLKWKHLLGAGMLGGIGFTMSIFISLLAFNDPDMINSSKAAILIASLIAGLAGLLWLKATLKDVYDDKQG